MNLKELAEKAGISYRSLFKPEEKQNCYYRSTIAALCEALDISTEEFYRGINYTPKKRRWRKKLTDGQKMRKNADSCVS